MTVYANPMMSFAVIGHAHGQCKPGALSPLPSMHMGTQTSANHFPIQEMACYMLSDYDGRVCVWDTWKWQKSGRTPSMLRLY